MKFVKYLLTGFLWIFLFFVASSFFSSHAYGLSFDLIAPEGQLTRGQDVKFTITVDTAEQSVSSAQIGMTYETKYLQYVSTTPGDTFTDVATETQTDGRLVFTGSSSNGFSGTGTFALVAFKLIATAPGSTQLCVLFNPSETPTTAPTTSQPTTAPKVTSLPQTGYFDKTGKGFVFGLVFILAAGSGLIFFNSKTRNPHHPKTNHKSLHK